MGGHEPEQDEIPGLGELGREDLDDRSLLPQLPLGELAEVAPAPHALERPLELAQVERRFDPPDEPLRERGPAPAELIEVAARPGVVAGMEGARGPLDREQREVRGKERLHPLPQDFRLRQRRARPQVRHLGQGVNPGVRPPRAADLARRFQDLLASGPQDPGHRPLTGLFLPAPIAGSLVLDDQPIHVHVPDTFTNGGLVPPGFQVTLMLPVIPSSRLARQPLLEHFGPEQLAALGQILVERVISPGQVLLRFGEPARREAFLLDSGAVRIQRATPYGIFPLAELVAGDMFGEAAFVDPAERSGDAVVLDGGRVLVLSEERLRPLLEQHPRLSNAIHWAFWKALSVKLRRTNERLLEFFAHGGPPPRVEPLPNRPTTGAFRIDLSAKRALFTEQKLSTLEINFLSSLSKERKLAAGTTLFREGDPGDSLYVILDGRIRISKLIPGAGEEALAILERGDYFGEMALIDHQPRSAMAKAHDGGAVVLEISREVLEGLLDPRKVSSPRLLELLCRLVAKRLREIDEKLVGWFILAAGNWPTSAGPS